MRWKRWVLWMVAGVYMLAPIQQAHAEERASDEAKLYFGNGVELLQNDPPNYQDAYYQFRKAYEVSKSWKVLGNLGLCAFKLERDGEALDYYTEYLRRGGKEIDAGERSALEREMLLITGNSAVVELTSTIPNLQVRDTRSGSNTPAQSYKFSANKLTLRVRAGVHTLSVSDSEGRGLSWEPALSPGETASHKFDFDAPKEPSRAAGPAPSGAGTGRFAEPELATTQSGGGVRIAGFVTAGLGVATLAAAGLTGIASKNKEDEAQKNCRDGMCDSSVITEADFNAKMDDARTLATRANVLWIAGGVVTAAGLGMIVFGGPSEVPAKGAGSFRLRLSPLVGVNGSGLFASGQF